VVEKSEIVHLPGTNVVLPPPPPLLLPLPQLVQKMATPNDNTAKKERRIFCLPRSLGPL
jgi:hypothetical protein